MGGPHGKGTNKVTTLFRHMDLDLSRTTKNDIKFSKGENPNSKHVTIYIPKNVSTADSSKESVTYN